MARRSRADLPHAIDLLWSHQIRRENAFLHKHVQHLQCRLDEYQTSHTDLLSKFDTLRTIVTESTTTIDSVKHRITATEGGIDRVGEHTKTNSASIDKLADQINARLNEHTSASERLIKRIDDAASNFDRLQKNNSEKVTEVTERLDQLSTAVAANDQQQTLNALLARVAALEDDRPVRSVGADESNIATADQLEFSGRYRDVRFEKQQLEETQHESEEEPMLTLRDVQDNFTSTSPEPRIDLDENVTISSYANHLYAPSEHPDSLQPISSNDLTNDTLNPPQWHNILLKQGRYHGWERYVAEGQSLMDNAPKEMVKTVVRKFVEGLYSAGDRTQCRQWLDLNGWTWANVIEYGLKSTPSIPTCLTTTAQRPIIRGAPPKPLSTAGEQNSKTRKRAAPTSKKRKFNLVEGLLSRNEPRRSQRIAGIPAEGKSPEVIHSQKRSRASQNGRKLTASLRHNEPAVIDRMARSRNTGADDEDTTRSSKKNIRNSAKRIQVALTPPSHQPERPPTPIQVNTACQESGRVGAEGRSWLAPFTPPREHSSRSGFILPSTPPVGKSRNSHDGSSRSSNSTASFFKIPSATHEQRHNASPELPPMPSAPRAHKASPRFMEGRAPLRHGQPAQQKQPTKKRVRNPTNAGYGIPTAKRCKTTERVRRRPPPEIPISPSSDDE